MRNRQEVCNCISGSARYYDLFLKFEFSDIIGPFDGARDEGKLVLIITGELQDDAVFTGKECLDIRIYRPNGQSNLL